MNCTYWKNINIEINKKGWDLASLLSTGNGVGMCGGHGDRLVQVYYRARWWGRGGGQWGRGGGSSHLTAYLGHHYRKTVKFTRTKKTDNDEFPNTDHLIYCIYGH